MTTEEAIDRLKGLYGNGYGEQEEALEMAIKALQDKGHDRKKARRFKNKYLKLKTAIGKIKAEIEHIGKATPLIGTNTVIEIIDKHIGGRK